MLAGVPLRRCSRAALLAPLDRVGRRQRKLLLRSHTRLRSRAGVTPALQCFDSTWMADCSRAQSGHAPV